MINPDELDSTRGTKQLPYLHWLVFSTALSCAITNHPLGVDVSSGGSIVVVVVVDKLTCKLD